MHATNFSWTDSIHVELDGTNFDLHNYFDFSYFSHDPANRLAILVWRRGTGEWVPAGQPQEIILRLEGVTRFSCKERDPELPFSEDACLASFGYVCDEEWADGQFMVDKPPDDHWGWSFMFQSGAEIRVEGEAATLEIVCE